MQIKIEDYLTDLEIKEIVESELREKIKSIFFNEENTTRILSNLAYEIVFNEIDKTVENSRELVKEKTIGILKDTSNYGVFRRGDYGTKKSLAYTIVEQAVKDNKELLDKKVKDTITDKDYSEEIWDKYEEMAETFISNFYDIVRLGRDKTN